MWTSMTGLVDETVSELIELCKQYPYNTFDDFFDSEELHTRVAIRCAERNVIASCARYFKDHPEMIEKWANYKK